MNSLPTCGAACAVIALAVMPAALSACGSGSGSVSTASSATPTQAPEVSPPGDIPDNQAFVRYAVPGAGVSVKVPEGWSRTVNSGVVTFTDKLNSITIATGAASGTSTVASVRATLLPQLAHHTRGYQAGSVSTVHRSAGRAVRITYLADGPADPVTGKTRVDAVERYLFAHGGRLLTLTLAGPKGADNVDPWRIVTDSVRWSA
jgi:hypothetical protein